MFLANGIGDSTVERALAVRRDGPGGSGIGLGLVTSGERGGCGLGRMLGAAVAGGGTVRVKP